MFGRIIIGLVILFGAIMVWVYYPQSEPESSSQQKSQFLLPSFDIVRVDAKGMAVVAGQSAAFAVVSLLNADQIIGSAHASGQGQWVIVLDKPLLLDQPSYLRLKTKNPDGSESTSEQIITIGVLQNKNDKPLIILTQPKKPSKVLQSQGVASEAGEILLETIDVDKTGMAIFSGKAIAAYKIRLYWNGRFIGQAVAKADESFQVKVQDLEAGMAILRLDLTDPQDKMVARIELPFHWDNTSSLEANEIRIQPGDNLWVIARHIYGQGMFYTLIYENNRDQIKDPHLIYPGQIFETPQP